MLQFKNIHSYGNIYNFSAFAKERWHITGATGTGKTTFFNELIGFNAFEKGDLMWNNHCLTHINSQARPISYLMQDCHVFPHLMVETQLKLMEHKKRAFYYGNKYLGHAFNRLGQHLSGGEKRLLGLIRVLCEQRPIMLLDEAFVGIDAALKIKIINDIKEHQNAFSSIILFSSHEKEDVTHFATHTYALYPS